MSRARVAAGVWSVCLAVIGLAQAGTIAKWSVDGVKLPKPIFNQGAVAVEGGILVFGGCTPEVSAASYLYRPGVGITPKADMPAPRHSMAVVNHNGKVYLFGGCAESGVKGLSGVMWSYDPAADAWKDEPPLSEARASAAAASLAGFIYLAGGYNEQAGTGRALPLVERFNSAAAPPAWEKMTPLGRPTQSLGVAVFGGKLYAIGGMQYEPKIKREIGGWADAFDPATNTWTSCPPMPTARCNFATVVVGKRIFVIGGTVGKTPETERPTDTVEYFDLKDNTWHADTPLPVALQRVRAVAIDNKIYVLGGDAGLKPLDTIHVAEVKEPLVGDLNNDGIVDQKDLAVVRQNMGRQGDKINPPSADINGDGVVNVADMMLVRNRMR